MNLVEPSAGHEQGGLSTQSPSIDDLPDELLAQVMGHLPCMDRHYGGPAGVSRRWRSVALDQKIYARPLCSRGVDGRHPYASAVALFHVDCIEYALERRRAQTANACVEAAAHGRLDLAVRFFERGCAWDVPEMAVAAASAGRLHALATLCETGVPVSDARVCTAAAAGGHLSCLEYAHVAGFPWDAKTAAGAAATGSLDCLTYLHRHGCPWDSKATKAALDPYRFKHPRPATHANTSDNNNLDGRSACLRYLIVNECPWYRSAFKVAAGSGAQMLALALDLGCPFDINYDVGYRVVCSGDAESATLLAARGYEWRWDDLDEAVRFGRQKMICALVDAGAPWDTGLAARLMRHNDSELVRWAIDRGLAWDVETCMMEAISAYGTLYRWFIESGYECPRLAKFCLHAAKCRQYEALEWLLAHDFPWDPVAGAALMRTMGNYCLAVLVKAGVVGAGPCEDSAALCKRAAVHDYEHDGGATIRTLYALGHRGDARATTAAASVGNIETLRWLIDQGCPVDHGITIATSAAWGDHVDCLRYLCETGRACGADVYAAAIRGGNVACLAYLDRVRCPRPDQCALLASQSGRLAPLRYLHEDIGVPLHPDACVIAVQHGNATCLRYAHKRGCEIEMDRCMAALESCWSGRAECERYLVAQRDAARLPSPPGLQKE